MIPTLGRSPWLAESAAALAAEGCRVVIVDTGPVPSSVPDPRIRLLSAPGPLGFAAATNLGLAATEGPYVATVNDDAIVSPGWLARLVARLDAEPGVGAVQGVNLRHDDPSRIDGAGIAWNRWWQAVQLGRDGTVESMGDGVREIWGVSATAALYRRSALESLPPPSGPFDEHLGSYYEDVELAARLRAAGWGARLEPRALTRHVGSATGRSSARTRSLIVANRWLVVARALGRGLWPRVPRLALRDLADLVAALREPGSVRGFLRGWLRAARWLPHYAHTGSSATSLAELVRLSPSPPR